MSFIVGRIAIKDFANIVVTDTRWDSVLDLMRERVSRDIEDITGRVFASGARVELHPSYEQLYGDPIPQYVIVDGSPIDTGETITLVWASFDDHDNNGVTLVLDQDYRVETDRNGEAWALRVQRFSSLVPNLFPLASASGIIFTDSPTGFQVSYTGGYTVSTGSATDPLDIGEEDVIAVPTALQTIAALKVAGDFKAWRARVKGAEDLAKQADRLQDRGMLNLVQPWTAEERRILVDYKRKDLSWVRSDGDPGRSGTVAVHG